MTIRSADKVRHIQSGKVGSVNSVLLVKKGQCFRKLLKVWWENESEVDCEYYDVREVKEIKTEMSRIAKQNVIVERKRESMVYKGFLQAELKMKSLEQLVLK